MAVPWPLTGFFRLVLGLTFIFELVALGSCCEETLATSAETVDLWA